MHLHKPNGNLLTNAPHADGQHAMLWNTRGYEKQKHMKHVLTLRATALFRNT